MPEPAIVLILTKPTTCANSSTSPPSSRNGCEYAADGILDDLASFANRDTIHPRSYVDWLTEDLASISARLRAATKFYTQPLDTSAPIGNQIPPPLPRNCRSQD